MSIIRPLWRRRRRRAESDETQASLSAGMAIAGPSAPAFVAVVRVLAASIGQDETASVTIHALDGSTIGAGLFAKHGSVSARSSEADAPRATVPVQLIGLKDEYARNAIRFRHPHTDDNEEDASELGPYLGTPDHPLKGEELYRTLGQPQLAGQYHRSQNLRYILSAVGVALLGAGAALIAVGLSSQADVFSFGCVKRQADGNCVMYGVAQLNDAAGGQKLMIAGGVATLVAPLALITAAAGESSPVKAPSLRVLVHDYNQRLRRRLGLPDERQGSFAPSLRPPGPRLSIRPSVLGGGAGLSLSVAF